MKKIKKFLLYNDYNNNKTRKYPQISYIKESDSIFLENTPKAIEQGVYIVDVDNNFFKENEWTQDNSKSIGVAVVKDNFKFIISKNEYYVKWGSLSKEITGCTTTIDDIEALKDNKGSENTIKIIEQDSPECDASIKSNAFMIGNNKGYLGTAGEWNAAYSYKNLVDSAMEKIGGDLLSPYFWTSTQYDSDQSWVFIWPIGAIKNYYKDDVRFVRPFIKIKAK